MLLAFILLKIKNDNIKDKINFLITYSPIIILTHKHSKKQDFNVYFSSTYILPLINSALYLNIVFYFKKIPINQKYQKQT